MPRLRLVSTALSTLALAAAWGCAPAAPHKPRPLSASAANAGPGQPALIAPTSEPVLYLGPEPDAPVFGFASGDVRVQVTGPAEQGRVPVRIDGPLRLEAYVPENVLSLAVQRRGRIRGTPVYVGPNDRVHPLGKAPEPSRTRVLVAPIVGGKALGPFEGTYPDVGLAAAPAPADAAAPDQGARYRLAPGRPLPLYEAPAGALAALVPAQSEPLDVAVISSEGGWLAVRVGEGPYLIGYTNENLELVGSTTEPVAAVATPAAPKPESYVPERLANEAGVLKRVAKGTELLFEDRVIAVFERDGWARTLGTYAGGMVDVFAAVDDGVALRGLVHERDLREPTLVAPPATPSAATPSAQ